MPLLSSNNDTHDNMFFFKDIIWICPYLKGYSYMIKVFFFRNSEYTFLKVENDDCKCL